MKFSYNSSPSSASYTTTNYDDNACQSKSTAGCIHGILRRFLCFDTSLPTHPSDHLNAEAAIPCRSLEDAGSDIVGEVSAGTPGLVARLMGLDSMPMVNHGNVNLVRRTKSMDSLRDVELVQRKHRHVKSTLSFRDAPTFLELEDEEFFILSFESGGKNKDSRSKPRKSDLGFSEMRTKRSDIKNGDKSQSPSRRQSNKENQATNHVSENNPRRVLCPKKNCHENLSSPEIKKQQIKKPINKVETKGRRLRKRNDQNCSQVEAESDSENTSPVSVLEFSELPIEFEVPSAVHKARLTSSNSRRILFEELKHYNSTPSISSGIVDNDQQEAKRDGDRGAEIWKRLMKHSQNHGEMWEEGCNYAETDMKQTKWMYTGVLDGVEFDEISATFEFEILDQLLQELVDQVFFL